ncbi:MAG: YfiR family protein [Bryobacteraceae bacterium]
MCPRLSIALILTIQLIAGWQERPPDEYQVKAAFLFNFAKFVEWPPGAFADPAEPLVICVLGEDPFGHALDDAVSGKKIDGRALAIRRISDARQAKGCRILFVSASERKRVLSILASAGEPGVLTVGESDSATAEGMIVNFIPDGGKVRFTINVTAAEREQLRFSSRLLSLAIRVKR